MERFDTLKGGEGFLHLHIFLARADADNTRMASYIVKADTSRLRLMIYRSKLGGGDPHLRQELGAGIREWAALLQARAVRNVSGYPVVYEGGVFRVQVVTGTLKGSIEMQYPYQTWLTARVFVNGTNTATTTTPGMGTVRTRSVAEYASAIEEGHKAIDLKQFMQGKVVPFFGSRAQNARGPYTAKGLLPIDTRDQAYGSMWHSEQLNQKLAAKGKGPMLFEKKGGSAAYAGARGGASSYWISFRRVGKTGWVIPEALPRPFMRAAVTGTMDQGRLLLVKRAQRALMP